MMHQSDKKITAPHGIVANDINSSSLFPEHRIVERRRSGAPALQVRATAPDGGRNGTRPGAVRCIGPAWPSTANDADCGAVFLHLASTQRALVIAAPGRARARLTLSLTAYGMEVATAYDGLYALMSAILDPPAIVFIAPPILGPPAASVARLLRTDDRTAHVPVVLLQANALPMPPPAERRAIRA